MKPFPDNPLNIQILMGLLNAVLLAVNLAVRDGSALNLAATCITAFGCGMCVAFAISLVSDKR